MTIKYPNGQPFEPSRSTKNDIKRPNQGHRGMSLESELNQANQFYLQNGLANIHKKPTPIQIVNVEYPKRSAAKITEAYFRQASTTDYNGIYQGRYLDFDAKETANQTSFPLSNVHQHQIDHLDDIKRLGGLSFFIIRFTKRNETYLIDSSLLITYWKNRQENRKSVPYTEIVEQGILIPTGLRPSLPYLNAVDQLIAIH
ncbi:Holliday junction resolvase RecU [Weissella koreensis]|uniref:Holliday junction resolvase RecU n=1 Tax=Weissella koreensis TaxID=165096 RepID=A0A7H1MN68_9LACO|nr:Holliday junction resolvase RecU [Weissella koreensis]AEJ24090.1 Holliday junction-specific endonuclease [Weissella koreensis KACC 15510]AVH75702.1 Holliday junction resolvase RecU [Weissella koreensis]EJF34691.1 recombination protein U [Weissella koreensis KCTC 3621]QGN20923.1 Holliday junction resolvase RecU [Weissella koreensis]QNT64904.1 Holliday junction resolvase RecU [Weissella koreensis]